MKAALVATAFLWTLSAQAGPIEDALAKSGCIACHSKEQKMMGPSFKEIAAKYKGQDAVAKVMDKVRKGGSGNFGAIPMAPNPPDKISDKDLKAVVEMILKS
jgi:cytochrome c